MSKLITSHDDMNWTTVSSEYLFPRPWLTVRRDCVRLPNGTEHPEFYILEYPTWVNVIAITDELKQALMVAPLWKYFFKKQTLQKQ